MNLEFLKTLSKLIWFDLVVSYLLLSYCFELDNFHFWKRNDLWACSCTFEWIVFQKKEWVATEVPQSKHDPWSWKIWLENMPGGKNPLECHLDFGWQFNFSDPVISLVSWFAPLNLAAAWRHLKGLVATPLGPDITYSGSCFLGTFQINLVHAYRPEPLSSCKLTSLNHPFLEHLAPDPSSSWNRPKRLVRVDRLVL